MADETSRESEAIAATAERIGGGLAAVVVVAGTFGAATGGLARLQRNSPMAMWLALGVATAAATAATVAAMYPFEGKVTRAWRIRMALLGGGGGLLLVVALALIVYAQTELNLTPYRPQVSVSFSSGSATTVKVTATAHKLGKGDRLSVFVLGPRLSSHRIRYFVGHVGANFDGVARQEAEVRIAQRPQVVQVVAVVRKEPNLGEVVDCEGNIFTEDGTATGTKDQPAPACLVLTPPGTSVGDLRRSGDGTDGVQTEQVTVTATRDFTATPFTLSPGDIVTIEAEGEVFDDINGHPTRSFSPEGIPDPKNEHPGDPLKTANHAALIGKVSEEGELFEIGGARSYESPNWGRLFLGINDGRFDDNHGQYVATVWVQRG